MAAQRTLEEIKQGIKRLGGEFRPFANFSDGKGFTVEMDRSMLQAKKAQLIQLAQDASPARPLHFTFTASSQGLDGLHRLLESSESTRWMAAIMRIGSDSGNEESKEAVEKLKRYTDTWRNKGSSGSEAPEGAEGARASDTAPV